jgi:hypothetical protein
MSGPGWNNEIVSWDLLSGGLAGVNDGCYAKAPGTRPPPVILPGPQIDPPPFPGPPVEDPPDVSPGAPPRNPVPGYEERQRVAAM